MNQKRKGQVSVFVVILSLCLFTNFVVVQASSIAKVTVSSLNLRSGPSTNYKVLGQLQKSKQITILSSSNNWYKVKTAYGTIGWVIKDYISITSATISRGSTINRNLAVAQKTTSKIVSYAKNYLGVKYVWGGTSPVGFDCSGFVQYAYKHFGISLNRVASSQATNGTFVSKGNLAPGDLVFFDTNGGHNYINHVGMYIGSGQFIQASSGHGYVMLTDITSGFYADAYMTARRIIA